MTAHSHRTACRIGVAATLRATAEALQPRVDLLRPIDALGVSWDYIGAGNKLPPDCSGEFDALFLLGEHVDRSQIGGGRLLLVARLGVGTEKVDLVACGEAGIMVTVTPRAVVRPMASAVLTFVLALAHKLVEKDALVRAGRWDERGLHIGTQLQNRTAGLIGLGAIAREFVTISRPLGLHFVAYDPYAGTPPAGVELVAFEELLSRSDVVVVLCALTPETTGLLDEPALSLMRPTAYLVNAARGPIIDENALQGALAAGQIAGAALDVLGLEPPASDHPLLAESNVILAPHSLGWTEQLFADMIQEAAGGVADLLDGRAPAQAANADHLDTERFERRLHELHRRLGPLR